MTVAPAPALVPSAPIALPDPTPADPMPGPFYRKGGHRAAARVVLPVPDEDDTAPKASDDALRFADAVDVLIALDAEALAQEMDSPVVQLATKGLGRWFDTRRPAAKPGEPAVRLPNTV